tara:strand:- start:91 stop:456 length:366 start_codon:yes stop_codon:yes gene_type:complete
MKELENETIKYFDSPVICEDETDYEDYNMRLQDDPDEDLGPIRVFCYLDDSRQNYFKFTLDDNGDPCVDIKLNEMTWTAGFQHTNVRGIDIDEQITIQLENIFKDISTKKIGVHHNNYHLD